MSLSGLSIKNQEIVTKHFFSAHVTWRIFLFLFSSMAFPAGFPDIVKTKELILFRKCQNKTTNY